MGLAIHAILRGWVSCTQFQQNSLISGHVFAITFMGNCQLIQHVAEKADAQSSFLILNKWMSSGYVVLSIYPLSRLWSCASCLGGSSFPPGPTSSCPPPSIQTRRASSYSGSSRRNPTMRHKCELLPSFSLNPGINSNIRCIMLGKGFFWAPARSLQQKNCSQFYLHSQIKTVKQGRKQFRITSHTDVAPWSYMWIGWDQNLTCLARLGEVKTLHCAWSAQYFHEIVFPN